MFSHRLESCVLSSAVSLMANRNFSSSKQHLASKNPRRLVKKRIVLFYNYNDVYNVNSYVTVFAIHTVKTNLNTLIWSF